MKFIKTPVKGTSDFIPKEMRLRQSVLSVIRRTYASYGFGEIETPAMEHIENLTGKQGGENEKLIFKILKRGAELQRALEKGDELADSGLRYDLTLPLSRFYAANADALPAPFKALQIGPVWRADRPQKGRFRQFVQCDIDILGDASILAEIELITATCAVLSELLGKAGIGKFTVHINDRRILRAMALAAGFPEEGAEEVFIQLDKLDKIGVDGVKEALLEAGFEKGAVEKYLSYFDRKDAASCAEFCRAIAPEQDPVGKAAADLDTVIACVKKQAPESVNLIFDPTLVRGMGYYTGTIFEITLDDYNFSVAGGGRYDEMIGKFSGQKVPACGFSIGFERIITVLKDAPGFAPEEKAEKKAILIEQGASPETMLAAFEKAALLRKDGKTVTVLPMKKNAKFQIDRLMEEGFSDVERIYNN